MGVKDRMHKENLAQQGWMQHIDEGIGTKNIYCGSCCSAATCLGLSGSFIFSVRVSQGGI